MISDKYKDRIKYRGQQSGEYYIYVDGKFRMSSDNFTELREDLEYIENELDEQERSKNSGVDTN